jgi:hypothetical protein
MDNFTPELTAGMWSSCPVLCIAEQRTPAPIGWRVEYVPGPVPKENTEVPALSRIEPPSRDQTRDLFPILTELPRLLFTIIGQCNAVPVMHKGKSPKSLNIYNLCRRAVLLKFSKGFLLTDEWRFSFLKMVPVIQSLRLYICVHKPELFFEWRCFTGLYIVTGLTRNLFCGFAKISDDS